MKLPAATLAVFSLATPVEAEPAKSFPRVAPAIVYATTPALGTYTDEVLFGDVWRRPELSPRDRSMVTVAALVAGGHTAQMTGHFNRALDNGVRPSEIAAVITHLAFYSGWPNAMSAVTVAKEVFETREIAPAQIAPEGGAPIALDAKLEAERSAAVAAMVGGIAPALAGYTNEVLFGDLWRRPDLSPRDRSLVTISALVAGGQADQLSFHLKRGMDNGLTRTEASEIITHLAFYSGWPKAMSAIPVAKAVFDAREAGPDGAKPLASPVPVATAPKPEGKNTMDILRQGSQPATAGSADYFTGKVSIASRFQRDLPARIGGGIVSFEAGARTAWHTHPLGQTLIVTSGAGWVQKEGGELQEINVGDVVWIPPGEKHWHGATLKSAMTHIAISEALDGTSVVWLEQVSDQQYGAKPPKVGAR